MTLLCLEGRRGRYLSWWVGRMLVFGVAWRRHGDGMEAISVYVGPMALEVGWPWQR